MQLALVENVIIANIANIRGFEEKILVEKFSDSYLRGNMKIVESLRLRTSAHDHVLNVSLITIL